jgi:hypothetical protein
VSLTTIHGTDSALVESGPAREILVKRRRRHAHSSGDLVEVECGDALLAICWQAAARMASVLHLRCVWRLRGAQGQPHTLLHLFGLLPPERDSPEEIERDRRIDDIQGNHKPEQTAEDGRWVARLRDLLHEEVHAEAGEGCHDPALRPASTRS